MLVIASAMTAMQGYAQLDYKVSMPNIQKFVTITTNAVNIREAPNVNSKKVRTVSKDMLGVTTSVAVIGEDGDWYKVYYYDRFDRYEYDSAIGYMLKKYCAEIPLEPVTEGMLQNMAGGIVSMCHQEKYKGLCFELNDYTSDGEIEAPLYVGKIVNGMWVFDKMLPTVSGNSFLVKRSESHRDKGIQWQLVYSDYQKTTDGESMAYLDSKKLGEANIAYLLQNESKMNPILSHLYYCFKGDKYESEGVSYWNWKCLFYNPQDFGEDIMEK